MIYDVYFWKKPGERRIYMSPVCPAPAALRNLRSQGYRILVGHVDLPDEPEEPRFDAEVIVSAQAFVSEFEAVPTEAARPGVTAGLWILPGEQVVPIGPLWEAPPEKPEEPPEPPIDPFRYIYPWPAAEKCETRRVSTAALRVGDSFVVRNRKGEETHGHVLKIDEKNVVVNWNESWRGTGTYLRDSIDRMLLDGDAVAYPMVGSK